MVNSSDKKISKRSFQKDTTKRPEVKEGINRTSYQKSRKDPIKSAAEPKKKISKRSFQKDNKVGLKVKEGMKRLSYQKPRQARIQSKDAAAAARKKYKLKRANYKKIASQSSRTNLNYVAAKKSTLEAKSNYKAAQKIYKKAKKKDDTRLVNITKDNAKAQLRRSLITDPVVQSMQNDDTLKDVYDTHQKIKRNLRHGKNAKNTAKLTSRAALNVSKHGYGFGNRVYNLSRGRGFHRTPKDRTTWDKAVKKARAFRNRIDTYRKAKKAQQSSSIIANIFKGTPQAVKSALTYIASNPISWAVILLITLVFMGAAAAVQTSKPAIQQKEFELTETWKYVTKIDAKHTDDKNTFYSDVDSIMFYMNNKFGEFDNKSNSLQVGNLHGAKNIEGYLDRLWVDLNGKKPDYDLTTMENLEKDNKSIYKMSNDDLEELKMSRENLGYTTLDGQLKFPYKTDSLVISNRFGYEKSDGKEVLNDSISTPVSQGQAIFAPLTGKVTNNDKSIVVVDEDNTEKVTLKNVSGSRYNNDEKVTSGKQLAIASDTSLNVKVEKYDEEKNKWVSVNPAFYFPKVTYTQFTTLSTDNFSPNGTMAQNALAIYNYLKPKGGTLEGIAAILGNLQQESSIDPTAIQSGQEFDDKLAYDPQVGGYALGVAQWDAGRRVNLLNYAKGIKEPWTQLKVQMKFATEGDDPADRTTFMQIAQSKVGKGVPELTEYFCTHWERAGIANMQGRVQNALNWYSFLKQENSGGGGGSATVPPSIKDKLKNPLPNSRATDMAQGYPGNPYGLPGQCVWYVWNRWAQVGFNPPQVNWGNALNWAHTAPSNLHDSKAHVDDAVVFQPGIQGAGAEYGHVAYIEYVNPDGTFWVTEENATAGLGKLDWRLIHPGPGLTYIKPVK
ncbi:phage tail tip lysozyme [Lactococcus formosensis]|uniref:phage tail tip lysozyme n=1 Tax=Lactococcus formosensis TaxID=1281486 RepID=UPI00254FFA11|nr:phage tail tip lysozyme [Lactococcus formosensis]